MSTGDAVDEPSHEDCEIKTTLKKENFGDEEVKNSFSKIAFTPSLKNDDHRSKEGHSDGGFALTDK